MDINASPGQCAPGYPSPLPAAQPVVRKFARKAIGNPSPSSGQEQQTTLTPGASRSTSVDISVHQGYQSQAPELHRSGTATSVASSGRDSVLSSNAPLSPLTNITTPSPLASPFQSDNRLTLSYGSLSPSPKVCAACNGYAIVQDSRLPPELWTVRTNSSARSWYEHRLSGFKTWITPMTAVVVLPTGWVPMRDSEGNLYYQNNITREKTRNHPTDLPSGWTESKDPDGKSYYVHHELQLASWSRPGIQPLSTVPSAAGNLSAITGGQVQRPSIVANPAPSNTRPQSTAIAPRPNRQGQLPAAVPRPGQQQVTLGTATEATINLFDPSNGGIVRNTKIVSHIAGQSVKGTVKAVAQNQRLQSFARGTGLATANKKVKKAWRKAAKEVSSLDGQRRQEIRVTQVGPQGKIAVQGADTDFDGEYVIEYEDGTIEYYDSEERLLSTSTVASQRPLQQTANLAHHPVTTQQRPPLRIPSHQAQGQQVLSQSVQRKVQVGPSQQGHMPQNPSRPPQLSQGSPQQNSQIQLAQLQAVQLQQGQPQQGSNQLQAQQIQTYQSQVQQAAQGQKMQAIQSQLQPSQSQPGQVNQPQSQAQAQQTASLLDQLRQTAQNQMQQAVQQELAQTQSTQPQQFQFQPQAQSTLQQHQQSQNQQMQQLLQQSKLQAQQTFNQQLQQHLQQQQQQQQSPSVEQVPPTHQTVYFGQSPAQILLFDPPSTAYVDQSPYAQGGLVHTEDTLYAAGDVSVEVNIEGNVYMDQRCQKGSYAVEETAFIVEEGICDQVYELQDDGCVDEVDTGECGGFEDAGCDI